MRNEGIFGLATHHFGGNLRRVSFCSSWSFRRSPGAGLILTDLNESISRPLNKYIMIGR